MRICWHLGRCTVREVLKEDLKAHKRDYRTILTFMTRMAKKGWLATAKRGNTNLYQPVVAERSAMQHEIDRFLEEVVGSEPERLKFLDKALTLRRAGPAAAVSGSEDRGPGRATREMSSLSPPIS